jgi:hypothetical protein|nr:FRG domain-containing protein [uncultured Halomonas sp.]
MSETTLLPTLDSLRKQLAIPVANTGQKMSLFGHRGGPVVDDIEGLHAIADPQGHVRLLSGIEFAMQLYRGQTHEYPSCTPTLARLVSIEQQLLALCRRIAFEDTIGEHPMVKLAEKIKLFDLPLYIDREGLAQHYGLATDMLDVTSNFDVASFFASCSWNNNLRKYEPFTDNGKVGVIYRITPALMIEMERPDEPFGPVHIVGWQPLPRPEQQRAFVVKIQSGQDFTSLPTVETFRFLQQSHISQRVWQTFEHGNVLFPQEAAAEVSRQAESLTSFTQSQIEQAWQRLCKWTETTYGSSQKEQTQLNAGITLTEELPLTWEGLGIETSEDRLMEQFKEVVDRVRYRIASYKK